MSFQKKLYKRATNKRSRIKNNSCNISLNLILLRYDQMSFIYPKVLSKISITNDQTNHQLTYLYFKLSDIVEEIRFFLDFFKILCEFFKWHC